MLISFSNFKNGKFLRNMSGFKQLPLSNVLRLLFHRFWSSCLAALHATLGTEFEISLFALQDGVCGFPAKVALLLAASLCTELGDKSAAVMSILKVKSHAVGAHQQAKLSCQDTCLDVFETT